MYVAYDLGLRKIVGYHKKVKPIAEYSREMHRYNDKPIACLQISKKEAKKDPHFRDLYLTKVMNIYVQSKYKTVLLDTIASNNTKNTELIFMALNILYSSQSDESNLSNKDKIKITGMIDEIIEIITREDDNIQVPTLEQLEEYYTMNEDFKRKMDDENE